MQKLMMALLLTCWSVCTIQAQNATLLARYPLVTDGKEATNKTFPLKLLGVHFNNGGAECRGVYEDYDAGKGVAILSEAMDELDIKNFSVRVDFRVSVVADMPVFVLSRSCRSFAFYLSSTGKVRLEVNNGDFEKESNLAYQTNTWHTATLVYQNGTAIMYLDAKEALRVPVQLSGCNSNNPDISTTNFSNAQTFKGHWRNLRIFKGAWNLQTKEDNSTTVVVNPVNPSNTTALGTWKRIETVLSGTPADAIKESWSTRRQFFSLKNKMGNLEVIWQDQTSKKIMLTRYDKTLQSPQHLALPAPAGTVLLAATNDEQDNYYYAVYQNNEAAKTNDILTLCKADKGGKKIVQQAQSSLKDDLNIFRMNNYGADLVCAQGTLCLMVGRTMNKSGDGLNHQGGIAVYFDANTLKLTQNFGQTSGHSFDNFLTLTQDGDFIGIDLGDNYPRGIHLHRFTANGRSSKLVYTFKTYHGTTAQSPAGATYPRYDEISTQSKTFYKWSNDNGTYTELGGIVEVADGFLIIFAGEPDDKGKSINNARIGDNGSLDSRNLAFVKVRKDFENAKTLKEAILSKGISEKGGFYTFGGWWTDQTNEGVTWLTQYKNPKTENVKYIKTTLLPNGNVLILYAVDELNTWGSDRGVYQPYMMSIDAQGNVKLPPTPLDKNIRFNRRDEVLLLGNQVISVQGDAANKKLILNILELK